MRNLYYDVAIAGCGVAGLYAALNLPEEMSVLMLSKEDLESCDSMLAQGGICVLRDEEDYDSYFEDTMRAGHYENRKESVDIMIRSSRDVINDLLNFGVRFAKNPDGSLAYTREGAHSRPRICFHEDITGKEITTTLLSHVKKCSNVTILEYTTMTDILVDGGKCTGMAAETKEGETLHIHAKNTIMATGGIGGLYEHSTNFPILTGDACWIAEKHGVELEHMDYVQIHPTCLYSKKPGRSFLISESARGEGAILLNHKGERFVNELLPRDVVTKAIQEEMATAERKATELANQTIDLIFPGEQQPESDHGIQYEQAETGTNKDRHFRRAKGWFGYQLKVKEEASRLLITVRKDDRNKVAILLNNEKLAVHPTVSEADKDGFITLSYVLPQKLNTGSCPIRFIPDGTEWTSAVYEVRLLK